MASLNHRDHDRQLIQALVARDRVAWQRFVERFQGLVFARVNRTANEFQFSLNQNDIEDICAEVFAGLVANDFRSLRSFQGRSSLATWLAVVAHRACLRYLHSRKQIADRRDSSIDPEDIVRIEGQGAGPLTELIEKEDVRRVQHMLDRLSSADSTVLRMFYLQNLSYQEIGDQMGISMNTVGPKLQRAQKRLRVLMEMESTG